MQGRSIRNKLLYTYGRLMFLLIAVFFVLSFLIIIQLKNRGIDSLIENSIEHIFENIDSLLSSSVRNRLQNETDKLLALAESYQQLSETGILTEEDAKSLVLEIIGSERIGNSGYCYVTDYNGLMLQHYIDDYIGEDFSDDHVISRQLNMQSGYLDYSYQNPGDPAPAGQNTVHEAF